MYRSYSDVYIICISTCECHSTVAKYLGMILLTGNLIMCVLYVLSKEAVLFSEGPLSEVPLYHMTSTYITPHLPAEQKAVVTFQMLS